MGKFTRILKFVGNCSPALTPENEPSWGRIKSGFWGCPTRNLTNMMNIGPQVFFGKNPGRDPRSCSGIQKFGREIPAGNEWNRRPQKRVAIKLPPSVSQGFSVLKPWGVGRGELVDDREGFPDNQLAGTSPAS